jgi:hypothetical protein
MNRIFIVEFLTLSTIGSAGLTKHPEDAREARY